MHGLHASPAGASSSNTRLLPRTRLPIPNSRPCFVDIALEHDRAALHVGATVTSEIGTRPSKSNLLRQIGRASAQPSKVGWLIATNSPFPSRRLRARMRCKPRGISWEEFDSDTRAGHGRAYLWSLSRYYDAEFGRHQRFVWRHGYCRSIRCVPVHPRCPQPLGTAPHYSKKMAEITNRRSGELKHVFMASRGAVNRHHPRHSRDPRHIGPLAASGERR